MKTYVLSLFFIFPLFLSAQKLTKVTKKIDATGEKEIYYVLKTDASVKHGSYQLYDNRMDLVLSGFYKNGVKDSIWTCYNGKNKSSSGNYINGERSGVWEFYTYTGKIAHKYDFTLKELVYFSTESIDTNIEHTVILDNGDTIKTKLDHPAIYIEGQAVISDVMSKYLEYPNRAKENGTQGKVWVTFTIDKNGKTSNHFVSKGIGDGCDEISLKVVKMIPDYWAPASLNGKPVVMLFKFPINFSLN